MNTTRAARLGAAALTTLTASALVVIPGTGAAHAQSDCPVMYALGVQGTGQSSPGTSPTDDTGFMSTVLVPLQAQTDAAAVAVQHEYLSYDASFGGWVPSGTNATYEKSVTGGVDKLRTRVSELAKQCSNARFALTGYSQGAHVVSLFAQEIGKGTASAVSADRVAGVALFGDPTRTSGATTFPGAAGQQRPAAAPGTSGDAVSAISEVVPIPPSGAGISASKDTPADFGRLVGRVASFCTGGDLSCDAPDNAPLLRAVANVAAQVQNPGDPFQALSNIAQALAQTAIKTATSVVNEDISGTSLSALSLSPKKSISQRLAEASDPSTPVDVSQVLKAVLKVGTIGISAVSTVARSMLTTSTITEIATAGLADPLAGLAVFGAKLASAVSTLIPPATALRWVQETFEAFIDNLDDNQDMLSAATWVKYSDVITRHGSYMSDPVTPTGGTAVAWVADWFAAAAQDLAGITPAATTSGPSSSPHTTTPPATSTTVRPN